MSKTTIKMGYDEFVQIMVFCTMIRFFIEDKSFNLTHQQEVEKWLTKVAAAKSKKTSELLSIFIIHNF